MMTLHPNAVAGDVAAGLRYGTVNSHCAVNRHGACEGDLVGGQGLRFGADGHRGGRP